jgi:hypothetical protein
LLLASGFCTFVSNTFSSHLLLLKQKIKKKNTKKKNHKEEKKNVEKRESLRFFSHFCIWDEALLLLSPFHIPSMLSSPPSSSLVFHGIVLLKLGSSGDGMSGK